MRIHGDVLYANYFKECSNSNRLRRYWHSCRGRHYLLRTVEYPQICGWFATLTPCVCIFCAFFVHFRNLADALVAITAALAFAV